MDRYRLNLQSLSRALKVPEDQQVQLQKCSWNDASSVRNTGNSIDGVNLPSKVLENLLNAYMRNRKFETQKEKRFQSTPKELPRPVKTPPPTQPPPTVQIYNPETSPGEDLSWEESVYDEPRAAGSLVKDEKDREAESQPDAEPVSELPKIKPSQLAVAITQSLLPDVPPSSSLSEAQADAPQSSAEPQLPVKSRPTKEQRDSKRSPVKTDISHRSPKPHEPNLQTPHAQPQPAEDGLQLHLNAPSQPNLQPDLATEATTTLPTHSLKHTPTISAPPCAQQPVLSSSHPSATPEVSKHERIGRPGRMNMPAYTQTQTNILLPQYTPVSATRRSKTPGATTANPASQTYIEETPLLSAKQSHLPLDIKSSPPIPASSQRSRQAEIPNNTQQEQSGIATSSIPNIRAHPTPSGKPREAQPEYTPAQSRASYRGTPSLAIPNVQSSADPSVFTNTKKRKSSVAPHIEEPAPKRLSARPSSPATLFTTNHNRATPGSPAIHGDSAAVTAHHRPTESSNMIVARSTSASEFIPQPGTSPYDWFCDIYPDFVATNAAFSNGIRYLVYLRNRKRLPECLYDDMLRSFTMDFPLYVSHTKKPMPAISWYIDRLDTPKYQSRAITKYNIDTIYLVIFGFPPEASSTVSASQDIEEAVSMCLPSRPQAQDIMHIGDDAPSTAPAPPSSPIIQAIMPPPEPVAAQTPRPNSPRTHNSSQDQDVRSPLLIEKETTATPSRSPDADITYPHTKAPKIEPSSYQEPPPPPASSTPPHPMVTRSRCSSPHHTPVRRTSGYSAEKANAKVATADSVSRVTKAAVNLQRRVGRRAAPALTKKKRKSLRMDWSKIDESSFMA
ncbi:hypothetical protein BROUX41_005016 [Berkeleyomyces rouxiae]|uniref:uncharacterized protein n=1 Tax=Berkeleyomyces rouxiae TaxID=2035830 RepID=UPI003B7BE430